MKQEQEKKNNREEENSKFYSLEINLRGSLRFECTSGRKSVSPNKVELLNEFLQAPVSSWMLLMYSGFEKTGVSKRSPPASSGFQASLEAAYTFQLLMTIIYFSVAPFHQI